MTPTMIFRRWTFRLAIVVGTSLTAWPGPAVADSAADITALTPGDHFRTLVVDRRRRSYLVHVPPSYDATKPSPVVVAFHGALMNATMMPEFSGLSKKSGSAGFIVVYPNGVGFGQKALFFNASVARRPNGSGPPDDVRFTAMLLDDLATVVNVDKKRVFATGMSNGGMMTHRVAAELADRFAAVAPVAGTLALASIHPSRPVPIMMFHGSADGIVPVAGPAGRVPDTMRFTSVANTVNTWRAVNGCDAHGHTTHIADIAHDGTTVDTTVYTGNADVVLVEINSGGHTWPGMQPPVAFLGLSTTNVSANDLMWEFFCRHPMK